MTDDLLLPIALLNEVTAEAMTEMAAAPDLHSPYRSAKIWKSQTSDTMLVNWSDRSSFVQSCAEAVSAFIHVIARATESHPTDVLRDLLGSPVSIPAQGWRVPRKCDYGRRDALEAHRFPGLTEWNMYLPENSGVSPASDGGEVLVHDIEQLP